jgi:ubiquinone/menaquinone biosynthesis C-methylase UbiE
MTPKEFYSQYQADDTLSPLNFQLMDCIESFRPANVFEFGCGTGKHLARFKEFYEIGYAGLDISPLGIMTASLKHELRNVMVADESLLPHLKSFDIVFTCSVLDHIEKIDNIINEFKRIAKKAIVLAETNDVPGEYYYPHEYERFGFVKMDYSWTSPKPEGDGATYHIWVWHKSFLNNDDFA